MRKPIGLNPTNISKPFALAVLILFAIFVIIGLFAGCGNDTITNNNNNNGNTGVLVFSLDSIGIYGTGFHVRTQQDTFSVNPGNLKTTLSLETNCDSLLDNTFINIDATKAGDSTQFLQIALPVRNGTYEFNNNVSLTGNARYTFTISFTSLNPRYLRFKNIKIYN